MKLLERQRNKIIRRISVHWFSKSPPD